MHGYWLEFSQVALAHLLAVISPGPDFAVVVKQSLTHGRRIAIWTSIGVGSAILFHLGYSLLGLGLLIRSSPFWFNAVRLAGAGYLGWLGVQGLRAKPRAFALLVQERAAPALAAPRAFAMGFLTNALNPKATLFFVSLFVLLVSPRTPPLVRAVYGVWMSLATMAWFSLVAVLFTRPAVQRRFHRNAHWVDRVLGLVLLGFAAALLFTSAKSG
jgi:RhtB (resistance to homoserine/threonine) family protein